MGWGGEVLYERERGKRGREWVEGARLERGREKCEGVRREK